MRVTFRALVAIALGACGVASAGGIHSVDAGSFVSDWTADNIGAEYWDNPSWDQRAPASGCNIGFYIEGSISGDDCHWFFDHPNARGKPGYLTRNGAADFAEPEFWFGSGFGAATITLVAEFAGFRNANELWAYYRDGSPAVRLFGGADGAGSASYFDPGGREFGFYIVTGGGHTFHTESGRNSADEGRQHFAVFYSTSYWIGVEDLLLDRGDADYNDLVFRVDSVPEPATFFLVGTALIALGVIGRRLSQRRSSPSGQRARARVG